MVNSIFITKYSGVSGSACSLFCVRVYPCWLGCIKELLLFALKYKQQLSKTMKGLWLPWRLNRAIFLCSSGDREALDCSSCCRVMNCCLEIQVLEVGNRIPHSRYPTVYLHCQFCKAFRELFQLNAKAYKDLIYLLWNPDSLNVQAQQSHKLSGVHPSWAKSDNFYMRTQFHVFWTLGLQRTLTIVDNSCSPPPSLPTGHWWTTCCLVASTLLVSASL